MSLQVSSEKIRLTVDGVVKVDGIPLFRRFVTDGIVYLELFDKDRERAGCRGTPLVQIPLEVLFEALSIQQEQT